MFYNNTQDWYEDDCTHCECNNGKINCKVQMCSPVHCDQLITVKGQCCPICANSSLSCDIHCPQGYKRDSSGKQLCECNVCSNVSNKCNIFCPFGFRRGSDGCEICECETIGNHIKPYKVITKSEDTSCMASNGTVIANDLYWNDGCRECFCNSGKIMCTKPNCSPIKCTNSILIEGKCCPVCADTQTKGNSISIIISSKQNKWNLSQFPLKLIFSFILLFYFYS